MNIVILIILSLLLFILELLYFKIAKKYNIIDQPNHRSSHTQLTLRGGGIIFTIALLIYPLFYGLNYPYFLIGLTIIAFVSFVDDIKPVSNRWRIIVHLISVLLMFYQLNLFQLPYYWSILAIFFAIGSINAINFMDGINGITGSYAFITLCSLLYINCFIKQFMLNEFLIVSIISVVVFLIFNFRKKAICFAGDVGSVSIAFIIMFFLIQLIMKTEDLKYILLLLIYGLDTVTTIIFRILRKEKIGDAHRSHFYQYLANEKKMSHKLVSVLYSSIQLLVNILIISFLPNSALSLVICLLLCACGFIIIRFYIEGTSRLLSN